MAMPNGGMFVSPVLRGTLSSSSLYFLSSDILACNERSFDLCRCLKEWGHLKHRRWSIGGVRDGTICAMVSTH